MHLARTLFILSALLIGMGAFADDSDCDSELRRLTDSTKGSGRNQLPEDSNATRIRHREPDPSPLPAGMVSADLTDSHLFRIMEKALAKQDAQNRGPSRDIEEQTDRREQPTNDNSKDLGEHFIKSDSPNQRAAVAVNALIEKGYTIVDDLVGSGGQARTLLALNTEGKPVLLKIPGTKLDDAFIRHEYKLLRRLNEGERQEQVKFFPIAHGIVDADKVPVLEMQFIPRSKKNPFQAAPNLHDNIENGFIVPRSDRDNRYESEDVDKVVDQLAEALKRAHKLGIVHRDLKPKNILIDDEGRVHIVDFGLSADHIRKDGNHVGPLELGDGSGSSFIGTPEYASPNQINNRKIRPKNDLYALRKITLRLRQAEFPVPQREANELWREWGQGVVRDYRTALERPNMSEPERLRAMAEWSGWPKNIRQFQELKTRVRKLDDRIESYPRKREQFLNWYGDQLSRMKVEQAEEGNLRPEAAREIISSTIAIEHLDSKKGLRLHPQAIDEIARGVWEIFDASHAKTESGYEANTKVGPTTDHPYYHFKPFFERLRQLHAEGQVSEAAYQATAAQYFNQLTTPSKPE